MSSIEQLIWGGGTHPNNLEYRYHPQGNIGYVNALLSGLAYGGMRCTSGFVPSNGGSWDAVTSSSVLIPKYKSGAYATPSLVLYYTQEFVDITIGVDTFSSQDVIDIKDAIQNNLERILTPTYTAQITCLNPDERFYLNSDTGYKYPYMDMIPTSWQDWMHTHQSLLRSSWIYRIDLTTVEAI